MVLCGRTTSSNSSKVARSPGVRQNQEKSRPATSGAGQLNPINPTLTSVTHTYDWTELTDSTRLAVARAMTPDKLRESMDRLAVLARSPDG